MARRPSFQFYPGDWLNDVALRACSSAARGLWIDMICIMVQCEPFGTLILKDNHKVNLEDNLHSVVGIGAEDCRVLLEELEGAGVLSRDEAGVIYSKRMVKDEGVRQARANGGKLGGNPALLGGGKDNPEVNHRDNLPDNHRGTGVDNLPPEDEDEDTSQPEQDPRAREIAERLATLVRRNSKVNITGRHITAWANEAEKLHRLDQVDYGRQLAALKHYEIHAGTKYWPVVKSGATWREKFTKVEDAIRRLSERGSDSGLATGQKLGAAKTEQDHLDAAKEVGVEFANR